MLGHPSNSWASCLNLLHSIYILDMLQHILYRLWYGNIAKLDTPINTFMDIVYDYR